MRNKFSIFNFQFSKEKGFTLIEVLTALTVLVVVGTIIGAIFVTSLKGTTKASLLTNARQNGTYAISQIEKTFRNAQTISTAPYPCVPTPTPQASLTVIGVDGTTTTFSCASTNINSNGSPLVDGSSLSVSACSFTCYQAATTIYPTIITNFTINQKAATSFFEQKFSIPFQSSVTLRNGAR